MPDRKTLLLLLPGFEPLLVRLARERSGHLRQVMPAIPFWVERPRPERCHCAGLTPNYSTHLGIASTVLPVRELQRREAAAGQPMAVNLPRPTGEFFQESRALKSAGHFRPLARAGGVVLLTSSALRYCGHESRKRAGHHRVTRRSHSRAQSTPTGNEVRSSLGYARCGCCF